MKKRAAIEAKGEQKLCRKREKKTEQNRKEERKEKRGVSCSRRRKKKRVEPRERRKKKRKEEEEEEQEVSRRIWVSVGKVELFWNFDDIIIFMFKLIEFLVMFLLEISWI
ncbi:hypothetical protein ACOSQ4_013999 [Xanthoceras sorbifolium]